MCHSNTKIFEIESEKPDNDKISKSHNGFCISSDPLVKCLIKSSYLLCTYVGAGYCNWESIVRNAHHFDKVINKT